MNGTQYEEFCLTFTGKMKNELTRYVNIADAKWRGSDKVPIGKVRELQQVKQDINAHKAMMITNIGFIRDAKNFAENHGIALHIVCPNFDYAILGLDLKIESRFKPNLGNHLVVNPISTR